eukprot:SAG31_NODE_24771_length_474_cov_0.994667_1_plen_24_part_10
MYGCNTKFNFNIIDNTTDAHTKFS